MADLIKHFTDSSFKTEISKGVTLVDFSAAWCGPCRAMAPIIEEVAQHFQNKAVIAKIDIDAEQKTAAEYQVTSIPTVILFKDGKEVNRLVGLRDAEGVIEFVQSALE